jgi:hypothetical protein
MLKNLAVALIATTLAAGTAFAAQPSTDNAATSGAPPAAANSQTVPANGQTAAKPANAASAATVKQTGKQARHHTAHAAKPVATKNVKSPT